MAVALGDSRVWWDGHGREELDPLGYRAGNHVSRAAWVSVLKICIVFM
jgi:hypothetical protein